MEIKLFKADLKLADSDDLPEGSVRAVFSTFNVVDEVDDVALPSFFTNGQEVAMASWGHSHDRLPPGKGVIRVGEDTAIFEGRFFLSTTQGREHYNTIKEMGGLQKWSFGYHVLEADYGEIDGKLVRYLKRGEVYEVSPVLIPANRNTYTLNVKGAQMTYADQADMALAAVTELVARTKALAALREKDGRALSETNRNRLAKLLDDLHKLEAEVAKLAEPKSQPKPDSNVPVNHAVRLAQRLRAVEMTLAMR